LCSQAARNGLGGVGLLLQVPVELHLDHHAQSDSPVILRQTIRLIGFIKTTPKSN